MVIQRRRVLVSVCLLVGLVTIVSGLVAAADEPVKFSLAADSRGKEGFVKVMKQLKAAGGPGLFLLTPGDMDPPKTIREQLDEVFGPSLAWYPVVGNHELEAKETGPYLWEYFDSRLKGKVNAGPAGCEQTTYSFDVGDVHIAVIDVYWNGQPGPGNEKHGGTVVPALRDWLKRDLQASTKPWKLVTGHEPAYPQPDKDWKVGRHVGDSLDRNPENRDAFWRLLEEQGVAAYICGHTHRYSRYQPEGSKVWQLDVAQARGDKDWKYDAFVIVTADKTSLKFDVYRNLKEEGQFEITDTLPLSIGSAMPPVVTDVTVAGGTLSQPLSPDQAPATVRESFQSKFPGVSKVEWKIKSDKNYEAEFTLRGVEVAAKFDSKGKWVETETAIEQTELTKEVRATLSKEYKGYKIIETQTVERAGDNRILFEVHLENAREILKVQLEGNGDVTSKSATPKKGSQVRSGTPASQRLLLSLG